MAWRWDVIAGLVREHGLAVGAEIGVAAGRFSAGLLTACPDLRLWGVDTWDGAYRTWMGTTWSPLEHAKNHAQAQAWESHFRPRLTLLRKSSAEAATWLAPASLDFVFIDADHDYEAVTADIAAWRTRLRPGGWITGHDYDHGRFPGVVRAVDEAFPQAVKGDDFTWMHQL